MRRINYRNNAHIVKLQPEHLSYFESLSVDSRHTVAVDFTASILELLDCIIQSENTYFILGTTKDKRKFNVTFSIDGTKDSHYPENLAGINEAFQSVLRTFFPDIQDDTVELGDYEEEVPF